MCGLVVSLRLHLIPCCGPHIQVHWRSKYLLLAYVRKTMFDARSIVFWVLLYTCMCVLLRIYRTWPNCDLKASNVAHMGNLSAQKRTNGTQRHQVVAQGGPHASPKGPKLEPKSPQERKIGKVKNARSQKVEQLKNHENLKITKVEMLIFHSFYNEN